jgi:hypothetical protein
MARQTEITIDRKNLGGLKTAPDLAQVKVLINGEGADVSDAKSDSIKVKTPPKGDGPWIILLTTLDGNKLLRALDLNYDPDALTFDVKQQQGSEPASDDKVDEAPDKIATALGDKVDKAADKIATAISQILSSRDAAGPEKRK